MVCNHNLLLVAVGLTSQHQIKATKVVQPITQVFKLPKCQKLTIQTDMKMLKLIPGEARLGRRPTGVAYSKITRVRVLSWPLPLLTSLYFCRSRKYCHEILSRSFAKASEAEIFTRVRLRYLTSFAGLHFEN